MPIIGIKNGFEYKCFLNHVSYIKNIGVYQNANSSLKSLMIRLMQRFSESTEINFIFVILWLRSLKYEDKFIFSKLIEYLYTNLFYYTCNKCDGNHAVMSYMYKIDLFGAFWGKGKENSSI